MPLSTIDYRDDDMRLPFIIKARVNKFTVSSLAVHNTTIAEYSTFNAFIRAMLKEGNL